MLLKYARFEVQEAHIARVGVGLMKDAHRHNFAYTPREGFLYVRSRAISSRTNDNFDTFPAAEIKAAWTSFIGKPVFVNHHNDDPSQARGVILDAALHEDTAPDGTDDTWVEVLMEIDAERYPKLAEAILAGDIERTSMGVDCGWSQCSFCGNVARTQFDYCTHVKRHKGSRIERRGVDGSVEQVLVHEICGDLHFFENSVLVEPPADPTAFFLGVDASMVKAAALKTAALEEGEAARRINEINHNLQEAQRSAGDDWESLPHPSIIDSCEENVHDSGIREADDPDRFWNEVLTQLVSELDSYGFNERGLPREGAKSKSKGKDRVSPILNAIEKSREADEDKEKVVKDQQKKAAAFEVRVNESTDGSTGYRTIYADIDFGNEGTATMPIAVRVKAKEIGTKRWQIYNVIGPFGERQADGTYSQIGDSEFVEGTPSQIRQLVTSKVKALAKSIDLTPKLAAEQQMICETCGYDVDNSPYGRGHVPRTERHPNGYPPGANVRHKVKAVPASSSPEDTGKGYDAEGPDGLTDLGRSISDWANGKGASMKTGALEFIEDEDRETGGSVQIYQTIEGSQDMPYVGRIDLFSNTLYIGDGRDAVVVRMPKFRDRAEGEAWITAQFAKRGIASKLAFGETKAPPKVNTLGMNECPVCGEEGSFDSTGRCRVCAYMPAPEPFRAPDLDLAQRVDIEDGWVNPELYKAPPFTLEDERDEPDDPPQPAVTAVGTVHTASTPSEGVETVLAHRGSSQMKPNAATLVRQQAQINRLAAQNEELRRQADIENPANPVPEPASESPSESTAEALAPDVKQDVESAGGEPPNAAPDAVVDVTTPGQVTPEPQPEDVQDVEAPVEGTTEPTPEDMKTSPDVDTSGETIGENAFQEGWTAAKVREHVAAVRRRMIASLRLASARIEAGIEADTNLVAVAERIEASNASEGEIRTEISTIARMAQVRSTATTQPQRRQASRIPSLAGGTPDFGTTAAATGAMPLTSGVSADEVLW